MRNSFVVCVALLAAYALGALHPPAHAENPVESTPALLSRLIALEQEQVELLKGISQAGELIRREREQAASLKTLVEQDSRAQRDQLSTQREQLSALKEIARYTERASRH